jgi:hypothetical protein
MEKAEDCGSNWTGLCDVPDLFHVDTVYLQPTNLDPTSTGEHHIPPALQGT